MADTLTLEGAIAWLGAFRDAVHEHGDHLTELDSAIGDADHGSNLVRGTDAVMAALDPPPDTVAALGKKTGMTLVTSVGGASGPLYGTFFLRAGAAAGDVTELDAAALGTVLRAGVDGIRSRGKAELGDKTMYDALGPAVDTYDAAVAAGDDIATAARAAAAAAAEGRDATEPMEARKGRASYLGERSVGHVDPGSASATMLLEALARTLAP
ncbi:dihydroxyacetone kinase subunit DhaL [Nocardioides sp. C4-1]|uniref:dihydroxyacetone kinase subunit DhaL n=1 Tax=Nocardioides sp. C4-1 TaxID=3151851 RepID=UPI003267858F